MSFSWDIKQKLCKLASDCPYCTRSELAGIVGFSGDFSESRLKLLTEHGLLADRIIYDLKECIGTSPSVSGEKSKRILIEDSAVLENLRACLFLADEQTENEFEDEILKLDCCRAAYIRGAFLGGGCVLDPEKSYHLEFDTKYKKSAGRLGKLLLEMGFPAKSTYRKGHYLVYLKGSEAIADILGLMGAGAGALAMYSAQMEKEIRNAVNRQVNCENANAEKLAKAAGRQLAAIRKIKSKQGLTLLPDNLKELAELRLQNPDASLEKLGKMLVPPLGKSGVNHRMTKIMEIAKDI